MSSATELQAWLNGIPTGGPNGDGRYPLTYADELTYLVYCPEAQALNPALSEEPIEVFANTASTAAATATAESDEAQQASTNAQTYAANAAASAVAADVSEANALQYAGGAATSSIAAANHAANAEANFLDAVNSSLAAQASASAASTSASNAATSASQAATSASVFPAGGAVGQFLWKTGAGDYVTGWRTLIKGDVGLGNVDNVSDVNKPISTAQQTALNLKANIASPTLTGSGNPAAPAGFAVTASGAYGGGYKLIDGAAYIGMWSEAGALKLGFGNSTTLTAKYTFSTTGEFTALGYVISTAGAMRAYGFGGQAGDGVFYFGDIATDNYIYKSGAQYSFRAGAVTWTLSGSAGAIWHAGNFTPASYALLTAVVRSDPGYLVGGNANSAPFNWMGAIADPSTNTPAGSWTDLLAFGPGGDYGTQLARIWFTQDLYTRGKAGGTWGSWAKQWSNQNDGAGSGLDADLIDGMEGNRLVRGVNASCTDDVNDMNSPTRSGFFQSSSGLNGPGVANWHWYMHHEHTSGGYGFQFANLIASDDFHVRTQTGGTWASWKKLWHTGNLPSPMTLAGGTLTGYLSWNNSSGAFLNGNTVGIQCTGQFYITTKPVILAADSTTWVAVPRTFVQSSDPGAQASDGDLWIW